MTPACAARRVCALFVVCFAAVFHHPAWSRDAAPTVRPAANALLAIDQNRSSVIDRIVAEWGDALMQSSAGVNPEQLRQMLSGLRSEMIASSLFKRRLVR